MALAETVKKIGVQRQNQWLQRVQDDKNDCKADPPVDCRMASLPNQFRKHKNKHMLKIRGTFWRLAQVQVLQHTFFSFISVHQTNSPVRSRQACKRTNHNIYFSSDIQQHQTGKRKKYKGRVPGKVIDEKFEIRERCKGVHCVDLGESFPTSIYLQNLALIQPRTSLFNFFIFSPALVI